MAAVPGPRCGSRTALLVSASVADEHSRETAAAERGFEWPRYSRILVAIDDTPAATFALRHVVPYAVDQRSQLTLLTVVPSPPASVALVGVVPERMAEEMEKEAHTHLRRLVDSLPQDLSVRTIIRHGDPAEEILAVARELSVDVVCMGARGRGRVTGALLGSVSTAVLHHSPAPVIVLHPAPEAERADE